MTVPRTVVVSCKRPKRRSYFLLQFCQVRTELIFHESNHNHEFQSHDELLYDRDDVRDDARDDARAYVHHGGDRGDHGRGGHGRDGDGGGRDREYPVSVSSQLNPAK